MMLWFYGMISNIDENIGDLCSFLKDLGIVENMILIFMIDNGIVVGDFVRRGEVIEGGWKGFNVGMRGKKGL